MSTVDSPGSVAIVGLGLIGGSLARDLSARGMRVSAFDTDAVALRASIAEGVVAAALDASLSGVAEADVVVIAVPVDCAADVLRRIAPYVTDGTLVTDVGSTKSRIVERAAAIGLGARFVGSHPMAGDHRSGWTASRAGLFTSARVYLCSSSQAEDEFIERAAMFWRAVSAEPVHIDASEHDRKLARASHLPHVMSVALGLALARGGISRHDLGPGGRDVTRLAGGSPDVWTAIARENAPALDDALADAERELAEFRRALASPTDSPLRTKFAAARQWFNEGL